MPELLLHRSENTLEVTFGEHHATIPWSDVAPGATMGQHIYDDAGAYGKTLFAKTFADEPLKHALTSLHANERLVLVIDDPTVAAIPWEYLRDPEGRLLASRLTMVRSVPDSQPQVGNFMLPLHIIAIPVSPVDDSRTLDTEGEWQHVLAAVRKQGKTLALTRVRPPTLDMLERTLHSERTTIVHFMGHSDSRDGKGLLAFEEAHGHTYLIEAADFADTLAATNIFLVVLNSCRSAIAWDWTAFGNIARGLVRAGVPYALGMQFVLPDDAALALSQSLYDFLLQGRSIEEAVRRTRRTLEHNTALHNPSWLAGIPVLYTSHRERPAAPLKLSDGQPTIQPDPERLQKTCDLAALPQAAHFVGRSKEISQALDALLASRAADFVVLHGLGGIGKTSLARAVADRVGWYYDDHVLAYSFETFARLDANDQRIIDETFADRFYNRLARFYELDPAQYTTTTELQQAILQRRTHTRSLLVLDNIETLIDAQKDHSAAKALATFVSRLKEGAGAILLTSRMDPPPDWGKSELVEVPGLEDKAGADLFFALLPADHTHLAPSAARFSLSRRVQGHPLSIGLLAGRFSETTTGLATFLQNIAAELEQAEQTTPTSLEDPERQKTLYACMDYSVKRLTPKQRKVLDAVSLFQAPFTPEFAAYILDDEEQTPLHLQNLVRLGLLNINTRTFEEGELTLLELHPMLLWYVHLYLPERPASLLERYGEVYRQLAEQSYQTERGYDQSSLMRYLVRQSLPDCEAALHYLPPAGKSSLAYYLAKPYERLGQYRRALALFELTLEIYQESGDVRGVAVTQTAMADVLRQQGKPQEALALYEQSLKTTQELGDVREVAVTQHAMADVLSQQGKPQEALVLYEQSLKTKQALGDVREVAVTQHAMADVLSQQGKPQEALALYEQSLKTTQELGDVREVAVTQGAMANVLSQQGKPQEALALYEQSLRAAQELGDVRGVAVTQSAMANVLSQQGKPQEALALYEQSLKTKQELGDVRGVAVTQGAMADVLSQQGKPQEALALYEQSLKTTQELGDVRGVAVTQHAMANVLSQQGKPQEALALYEQSLRAAQELGDVRGVAVTQSAMANVLSQQGKPQEALALYEQSLKAFQTLGEVREVAETQGAMAEVLSQQGKLQEALALYEQSLKTDQQLGDVRGVAVTQANFCQLLLQIGEYRRALSMAWEAYTGLSQNEYTYDAQAMQRLLISIKGQVLGPEQFDMLWKQLFSVPQPAWLHDVQLRPSPRPAGIPPEEMETIVANTIAVMTTMPEKRAEWQETVEQAMQRRQSMKRQQEAEFFAAILALLDGLAAPALPEDHLYAENLSAIQAGIAASEPQSEDIAIAVSDELMQAVRDFVNADDWDATQQVVEAQQALLFQSEVEALFEQNIDHARSAGEQRAVDMLEQHLALLRACKKIGIAEAFKQREQAQEIDLPFDAELIPRSIAALLGSPQEKMAYAQYLIEQTNTTTDEQLKALIQVVQLALFSPDLSQLGRDLQGVYRQAWDTIAATVEADGINPRTFELIANNTLAVLGPASNRRSEWRAALIDLRNQATVQGNRNMVALLEAVIGLLDAGGDPTGLGVGLKGIYAQTWQAIVEHLSA